MESPSGSILLSEIKRLSDLTAKTALPLMQKLISDDNDYVKDVLYENEELSPEEVADELRNILEELVEDTRVILTEIDKFSKSFLEGTVDENEEAAPFLYQIWSGDAFGEPKEEGLKLLVKDLEQNLSKIDEDYIINEVLRRLGD